MFLMTCDEDGFLFLWFMIYMISNSGCPACSNNAVHIDGRNSFGKMYPELIKEFDSGKNGDNTPFNVPSKSHKKIWWICSKCQHEWKSIISSIPLFISNPTVSLPSPKVIKSFPDPPVT